MARRNEGMASPPIEWTDGFEEHDSEVTRVRMLWRTGRGEYRPLIPGDSHHELDATHFEWNPPADESPPARRARIVETVSELWEIANDWARDQGVRCDFKLIGFDAEDEVLFESGKRAAVSNPSTQEEPQERVGFFERRHHTERYLDKRMSDLLTLTIGERDKAFVTARESLVSAQKSFRSVQESIDAAPQLLSKASEILKETLVYQDQQVREIRNRASGRIEMRAHALSEMERSRRFDMATRFGMHALEALFANGIPLANKFFEVFGNRQVTVFPEFKVAQQAMAYLIISLTPHQLTLLFGDKRGAAAATIGLLDEGAAIENEREALEHVMPVVRVLRSEKFRNVATPEEQLAARFIIGRLALYRMSEYGEGEEQPA